MCEIYKELITYNNNQYYCSMARCIYLNVLRIVTKSNPLPLTSFSCHAITFTFNFSVAFSVFCFSQCLCCFSCFFFCCLLCFSQCLCHFPHTSSCESCFFDYSTFLNLCTAVFRAILYGDLSTLYCSFW